MNDGHNIRLITVLGAIVMQSNISRPSAVSDDARVMMLYEANKKSTIIAYLLWWFLGWAGGHRFYNGKVGSGIAQLLMFIGGSALLVVYVGAILLLGWAIWWIVDAFLIPGWVRNQNNLLATQLGA